MLHHYLTLLTNFENYVLRWQSVYQAETKKSTLPPPIPNSKYRMKSDQHKMDRYWLWWMAHLAHGTHLMYISPHYPTNLLNLTSSLRLFLLCMPDGIRYIRF